VQRSFDAYRLLQVDPQAEPEIIHAAYRVLARRYHPDGSQPNVARMAQLNAAYATLRDPESRRRYDARRPVNGWQPVPVTPWPASGTPPSSASAQANHAVIDFGRYQGWRIADLARHDPTYLRWLSRHSAGVRFRDAILQVLPPDPDLSRRASSVA
jgi:curved DNA-binding protein CbpA